MERTNSIKVNASLNAVKQICGIIFPILSFSYASRVVGADGIGIYSFAQSIVSYLLLLASIGVTHYAVRDGAKIKDDKNNLTVFCNEIFSINILFSLFAYLVLIVLLLFWTRLQVYRSYLLIQSSAIILTTLGADWINTIQEDYIYITLRYIAVQVASFILLVLFVRTSDDLLNYVIICTLSSVGGNILNIFYIRKYVRLRFTYKMNLKKHIIPLFILFINSIASVIYLNSDITMLNIYTDDKTVGIYTISTKVYFVLKTLVNGITYVTVPRFSYYLGKHLLKEYQVKLNVLLNYVYVISIPLAVGMFFQALNILNIFAGDEFSSGSGVIKILSVAYPFAVGSCVFSYAVLIPNNLEKYFMYSTLSAAFINILLNLIAIPLLGMEGASYTTLVAEVIVFAISIKYSKRVVKIRIEMKDIISVIIGSIFIAIVCMLIDSFRLTSILSLAISVLLSCSTNIIILMIFKNSIMLDITLMLQRKLHNMKSKA